MLTLPADYHTLFSQFEPLFSRRIGCQAQVLLVGAILAPGRRTVTAVLRIMALSGERHFQNYHRVLNRAVWSGLAIARVLLRLLVRAFVPHGPLIFGLDNTLERRRGTRIAARGVYHDPVRSSKGHFVKASGLRWLSLMLLTPISRAGRVWALPFLTVLGPSERYYQQRGRRHKNLVARAGQLLALLRRWLPDRMLGVVADSTFAARELLARVSRLARPICLITRLRLDAALYAPPGPREPGRRGPHRKVGERLPALTQILHDRATDWQRVTVRQWYSQGQRLVELVTGTALWYRSGAPPMPIRWLLIRDPLEKFQPQALLCTDLTILAVQILEWFLLRWQLEVTFQEVRTHLGVETQRQWSERAIARTTPALLGLFSLVALLAQQHVRHGRLPIRQTAWYGKSCPTFSDALAMVRRELWQHRKFQHSRFPPESEQFSAGWLEPLLDSLCYTA